MLPYWEGGARTYHHTAPINPLYGLHEALLMLTEEGLRRRGGGTPSSTPPWSKGSRASAWACTSRPRTASRSSTSSACRRAWTTPGCAPRRSSGTVSSSATASASWPARSGASASWAPRAPGQRRPLPRGARDAHPGGRRAVTTGPVAGSSAGAHPAGRSHDPWMRESIRTVPGRTPVRFRAARPTARPRARTCHGTCRWTCRCKRDTSRPAGCDGVGLRHDADYTQFDSSDCAAWARQGCPATEEVIGGPVVLHCTLFTGQADASVHLFSTRSRPGDPRRSGGLLPPAPREGT